MTSRALRYFAILGLGLGSCTQGGFTLGGGTPTTAVVVDPAEFLGEVVCLDAEGAMRRYVATLIDVSPVSLVPEAGNLTLPSSAPTACWKAVHFERVTSYRDYVAEIDGYDRTDISPLSPGSRIQVDAEGRYVPPRWTTSCGRMTPLEPEPEGGSPLADAASPVDALDGSDATDTLDATGAGDARGAPAPASAEGGDAGGTPSDGGESLSAPRGHSCFGTGTGGGARDAGDAGVAVTPPYVGATCSIPSATVVVRDCGPLVSSSGAPPRTGISVDVGGLRGIASCDGEGGVTSFTVRLVGSTEAPRTAACGDTVTFDGLTAGGAYTVQVGALDASGQTIAGTTCFRRVVSGLVLPAACDPLAPAT